jgi:eukaryotic-like serine/threonine-protein kinase
MTPTRWQQVDQLLEATLDQPLAEREAFLVQACQGDETLRQEVWSLLAGSEQAEDFFEASPVHEVTALVRQAAAAYAPGSKIGPYRILRELGRGGMGLVLLAVRADDSFQKQVAIKLVSPGPLQSQMLRRFRRERQILADLEHPNIARLLDGGTTEQGWPYVVMEYVEGVPLTQYCRAQQQTLTERLHLFREICAAVQYAHQRLVIHRDLKPANILVTQTGAVKLLDFGIAKLLSAENPAHTLAHERASLATPETLSGVLMMTPEYASPEQMRGETLTTASDIYSLGVLLYELLSGQLPYQLKTRALPEIIRAVCETEPERPSVAVAGRMKDEGRRMKKGEVTTLRPASFTFHPSSLRGDLDNITLTALHKDPAQRYRTVQQMSEDLRRHLAGELVFARQATLGYRLQRFAQRNRGVVLAAALVSLTLVAGIAATWQQARLAQAQARANHRLAYAGQMHLAMQAWELANMEQLRDLIEQSKPKPGEEDLRGFEWYHLWQLAYRNGENYSRKHPKEVWSVAYAPDGQRVASGCDDGKLRVWEAATGKLLAEFEHPGTFIWSVAWSPDGQQIAAALGNGTAQLWEAATGRALNVLKGHTHKRVDAIAFAPDGKTLATGSRDGTARLWEAATGRELLTLKPNANWVNTVAFSPNGRWLVTGHSTKPALKLWDVTTGRELLAFGHNKDTVWAVAFAPDGQRLVSGHKYAGSVSLWDLRRGQEIAKQAGHRDEVKAIAYAPNGTLIATASADRTIKLWDAQTFEERATLKGNTGSVWSVAFAPDSRHLISGDSENTLKHWDLAEALNFNARNKNLYQGSNFAVFSPDNHTLALGRGSQLEIVEAVTGRVRTTCVIAELQHFTTAAFAPDGAKLFTGASDGRIGVWDTHTGQELMGYKGHEMVISSLAVSPDGRTLVTGSQDATVKLWQTATGQLMTSFKDPNLVRAVAFSPNGKWLISGGHDNAVLLRETATGQLRATLRGHTKPILSLAFAPDGKTFASGSADGTGKLWEVATGRERAVFKGPAGHVRCLDFSPDGSRLATGSSEGLVRLWDIANQEEVIALKVGEGSVRSVAFSPDGRILAGTSTDPMLKLWRAATSLETAAASGPPRLAPTINTP